MLRNLLLFMIWLKKKIIVLSNLPEPILHDDALFSIALSLKQINQ